jgi:hypothetical protein
MMTEDDDGIILLLTVLRARVEIPGESINGEGIRSVRRCTTG